MQELGGTDMGAFWKWFLDFFYPIGSEETETERAAAVG